MFLTRRSLLVSLAGGLAAQPALPAGVTPLPQAFAHNDYEHPRPLLDALDHGFCAVEADVYLVEGGLLVAHEPRQVRPARTLEALYLDPLRDRARKNDGRVYRDGLPLTLLVDLKSEAETTYAAMREVLKRYSDILTHFRASDVQPKAVRVVLSGNRPRTALLAEPARYAAFDGRIEDLGAGLSPSFMPLVSDNWRKYFTWRGDGDFPEEERAKLADFVRRAHAHRYQLRFWQTPERPEVWRELLAANVDYINTDDLPALRRHLTAA